jgi:hypothetical protein
MLFSLFPWVFQLFLAEGLWHSVWIESKLCVLKRDLREGRVRDRDGLAADFFRNKLRHRERETQRERNSWRSVLGRSEASRKRERLWRSLLGRSRGILLERGIGSGVFWEEVEASCWGSADLILH